MRILELVSAAALVWPFAVCAAGGKVERGLRFDSPSVLDLSARPLKLRDTKDIATAPLDVAAASAILAAPALSEDNPALPFSAMLFGCGEEATDCAKTAERTRIDANSQRVAREGNRLVITPADGPAAIFIDWTQPSTKKADGDAETHYYLGHLAGSDYHRVEVQFGHDAPGSFLVNPKSGKAIFVHNGGDATAISPSGRHIVDLALSDEQHPLRIAMLDDETARIELQCIVAGHAQKIDARLKGWHDPFSLDLELDLPERAAVRLKRAPEGSWTMATADAARVAASGFRCE